MCKKSKVFINWAMVIGWMGIIFIFSSQVASDSDNLSRGVTELLLKFIPTDMQVSTTIDIIGRFNHIVRKCAHGGVYFILGLLTIHAIMEHNMKIRRAFITALMICVIYAISDEFHQSFVPGRGPAIKDVCIDSFGAFMGIIMCGVVKIKILVSS